MKKLTKALPLIMISVLMAFAVGMTSTAYANESGSDGGVQWSYYDESQTMIIEGTGGLKSDGSFRKYKDQVRFLFIHEGIGDVWASAFRDFTALEEVEITSANIKVRDDSFRNCKKLVSFSIPATADMECVYTIESDDFNECPFWQCDRENIRVYITGVAEDEILDTDIAKKCNLYGLYVEPFGRSLPDSIFVDNVDPFNDDNEMRDEVNFGYHVPCFAAKRYTGKAIKAKPFVKVHGSDYSKRLVEGTDYKLSYSNNKDVGIATCKITGLAPFYGSRTVKFAIYPKGTSMTKTVPAKKAFTVKWCMQAKKMSKKRITGYKVMYSTYKDFRKAKTKTVKGYRKTSVKIKGLKAKTKYYVKVATYYKTSKDTFVSSWSKASSVKTK